MTQTEVATRGREHAGAPGAVEVRPAATPAAPAASAPIKLLLPVGAYLGAQLTLLVVAVLDAAAHGTTLVQELTIWDGQWYLKLAAHGYPAAIPHSQSTLGFLPLYPALMWVLSHGTGIGLTAAGLLINQVSGLVATVLVCRLCTIWWGPTVGRRATLLHAFFPASVVFALVYSDGLFLALVLGCLLCLEFRRWWWAGVLAGLATATGADGAVLVVCCASAALLHLWRTRVWEGNWQELRCLATPVLAPFGLIGFACYLWVHTGSPLASFDAQSRYWDHHVDVLTVVHTYDLFLRLHGQLSLAVGLLGVPLLLGTRYLLVKLPDQPPGYVLVWAFGVTALILLSAGLTPNPRMLLFAFPNAVVLGRWLRGPAFVAVLAVSATALVALSWLVFSGNLLP